MPVDVLFETHATSEDNEAGRATGWLPGALTAVGREQAAQMGRRRRNPPPAAVFSSDLRRAMQTVEIAFSGLDVPILLDWRLRECNYGDENGGDAAAMHADRGRHIDHPYPGGESWRGAVDRVSRCLADIRRDFDGHEVLVVGHVATRWAIEHTCLGTPIEELVSATFVWHPGWHYRLP